MLQHWSVYFLVALGSAFGGVGRLWVSAFMVHRFGVEFPWGTLIVNVIGSLAIGLLAAFTVPEAKWMISSKVSQFFMVGVCGGFTTFSTFSLQTLDLMQKGSWTTAFANIGFSLILCLVAVWAGYVGGIWINR